MKRIIATKPPYDKTKEGYGISGLSLYFILKGKHGAVQVWLYTNLYPIHIMKRPGFLDQSFNKTIQCFDVGYHSKKKPDYMKRSDKMDCHILGKCYYDGSSLRGDNDKVPEIYLEKGDEGVWEYLEKYYKEQFGELK